MYRRLNGKHPLALTASRTALVIPIAVAALLLLSVAVASSAGASKPTWPATGDSAKKFVPGEVIVRYRPKTEAATRIDVRGDADASFDSKLPLSQLEIVKLEPGASVTDAVAELNADPRVEYAEPNYIATPRYTPNDLEFGNQWALNNTGQTILGSLTGTPDADIDAPEAWNTTHGSSSVIVADVDTGVDYTHEDLSSKVWTNSADGPTVNGVDDDGNGYVDDYRGWDFISSDRDPMDEYGHGTNTAGVLASATDNTTGVSGTGFDTRVMALRANNTGGIIKSYQYAAAKGARIANLSFGSAGSIAEQDMIESLPQMLFVAAAPNASVSVDTLPAGDYPCGYSVQNMVCVAASSMTDTLTSFSAWGPTMVDLAAPGEYIETPNMGGGYGYVSGTSFATPMTAGVAALLVAADPSVTPEDLKFALIEGVDKKPAFAGKLVSEGRLNAANSLTVLQNGGASAMVSIRNSTLQFEGYAGSADSLNITQSGSTFTITNGAAMTPGANCSNGGPDTITCVSSSVTAIRVRSAGGNDTVTNSTSLPSTLYGGDGADTLIGGTGNDRLIGGDGADVLNGSSGTDTADYSARSMPVTVDIDNVADDGDPAVSEGDNVLDSVENLTGGAGGDTLTGSSANNTIYGGSGNNTIYGGGGDDQLSGSVGSDDFHGEGGTDTVDYSTRPNSAMEGIRVDIDDTADDGVGSSNYGLYSVNEQDNVRTDVENVNGTKHSDTLTGSSTNNRLDGGMGTDTLDGGLGNDVLIGGLGVDSMTYASRTSTVVVDLDGVADDGQTSLSETDNVGSDIENLTTGSGNDTITGSSADNVFDAGLGADVVNGGSGSDTITYASRTSNLSVSINGTANDGVTSPAEGDNVTTTMENVIGGSGNDTLSGSTFDNKLVGGDGTDTLTGSSSNDVIVPGAGTDSFTGGSGTDTISYETHTANVTATLSTSGNGSSGENETIPSDFENLTGGGGTDTLTGTSAVNVINGHAGNDTISGLGGNDDLQGDAPWKQLPGRLGGYDCEGPVGGADTLNGGDGDDLITGGPGADTLHGDAANDRLRDGFNGTAACLEGTPDSEDDQLYGDAGTDVVDYSGQPSGYGGVRTTIDDVADDGVWGTNDNIRTSVEKVIGTPNYDWIRGGTANDVLVSGGNSTSAPDTIDGLGGNDTLVPGGGQVQVIGGDGTDTVDYSTAAGAITVSLSSGIFQPTGGSGDHHISTVEGIIGSAYSDTFTGSDADNTFDGGAGADVFNGLLGTDTVTYATKAALVTADIDGVADDGNSTDGSTTKDNVKTDIENLTGSPYNDVLSGSTGNNLFLGGAGRDTFNGLGGTDTVSYNETGRTAGVVVDIDGTADDGSTYDSSTTTKDNVKTDVENVTGTNYTDTLTGSTGNNFLLGLLGADTLSGGNGDDTLDANDDIVDTSINCGGGTLDILLADPTDPASSGCESISFP